MGLDGALLDAPDEVCQQFAGHVDREKSVDSGILFPPSEGCVVNRIANVVNAVLMSDGEQVNRVF